MPAPQNAAEASEIYPVLPEKNDHETERTQYINTQDKKNGTYGPANPGISAITTIAPAIEAVCVFVVFEPQRALFIKSTTSAPQQPLRPYYQQYQNDQIKNRVHKAGIK